MGFFIYRLAGAALFDGAMYEAIERDRQVTPQAAVAVVLSSLSTGIGVTASLGLGWHPLTLAAVSGVALATWVAWASLVFHIGTRVLPAADTRTGLGELLRTTGFAAGPGMLHAIAAVIPAAAGPIFTVTGLWMFGAMVVAVEHALDYRSVGRAVLVCAIGAGLCLALAFVLGLMFARTAS